MLRIFGIALLWACFDDVAKERVLPDSLTRIRNAYSTLIGAREDDEIINPVKRVGLIISGDEDHLHISEYGNNAANEVTILNLIFCIKFH